MPALTEIFGDDSVLQFGGGTLGYPWGNVPGVIVNRVAKTTRTLIIKLLAAIVLLFR